MEGVTRDFYSILRCLHTNNSKLAHVPNDKSFILEVKPFFSVLQASKKRPDAFSIIESTILLLDHFQFDNTKATRKGSKQKQVSAGTDRKFEEMFSNGIDFSVVDESAEKSGQLYVENFKQQFLAHAIKINGYKTDIQIELGRKYESFLVGFIIEDASPLGSIYRDKGGTFSLDLVYTKEFLDLFEQTPQLDFVIFAMTGGDSSILSFISRNTIPDHRENQIEASNIPHFLFENSYCAGGQFILPV